MDNSKYTYFHYAQLKKKLGGQLELQSNANLFKHVY